MVLTKREHRAEVKRLDRWFRTWKERLGLRLWTINIRYHAETGPEQDNILVWMDTTPAWEYQDAAINVYCGSTVTLPDDVAEYIVVHELVHVLLSEMYPAKISENYRRHSEHATTLTAKAFINTYREGENARSTPRSAVQRA